MWLDLNCNRLQLSKDYKKEKKSRGRAKQTRGKGREQEGGKKRKKTIPQRLIT